MNSYDTPFKSRYASEEMLHLFSPAKKFTTWRKLWTALAEAEKELGLDITDEQIRELKDNINNIDYSYASEMEKKFRHDVMAHVHAYGKAAPKAMPVIHLGATSCFVCDNADILIIKEALELTARKTAAVVANLKDFAVKYKNLPTLGFTHFQPAQLTTVGKRATLWIQDLIMDLENIDFALHTLMLLGSKGTTGTQASFMSLFNNDHQKVVRLDKLIAEKTGMSKVQPVSGQTYSRKQDSRVLSVLAGIAESAHKFATDIRLLANLKEIEEPFEKNQIGSSAMAYKRNPMRSERVCSIARFVISISSNPYYTHATQWLERTLDDSANRRLCIPEAFLAVDSILALMINITNGLVVYERVIERRIKEELPFMATENIIMESVKKGADRQEMHEIIRVCSMEAAVNVKQRGMENNLLDLLAKDKRIPLDISMIKELMNPHLYIGRAPEQTVDFVEHTVNPLLEKYNHEHMLASDINV